MSDVVVTRLKRCPTCKETLPVSEFTKNRARYDGIGSQCKKCTKIRVAGYAKRFPEKGAARCRRWSDANPGKTALIQKRYRERNRQQVYLKTKRERIEHPERVKARKAVHYAVTIGKLIRPNACEECGQRRRVQAHHADYLKQLDVRWLCAKCHKLHHLEG